MKKYKQAANPLLHLILRSNHLFPIKPLDSTEELSILWIIYPFLWINGPLLWINHLILWINHLLPGINQMVLWIKQMVSFIQPIILWINETNGIIFASIPFIKGGRPFEDSLHHFTLAYKPTYLNQTTTWSRRVLPPAKQRAKQR